MPRDLTHLFSLVITMLGRGLGLLAGLMVGSVVSQLGGTWGIRLWDTHFLVGYRCKGDLSWVSR